MGDNNGERPSAEYLLLEAQVAEVRREQAELLRELPQLLREAVAKGIEQVAADKTKVDSISRSLVDAMVVDGQRKTGRIIWVVVGIGCLWLFGPDVIRTALAAWIKKPMP